MPDHDQPHSHSSAGGSSPQPDRVDLTGDYSGPAPMASVSVASLASPPRLSAGRYQLLDEIAHGGMGVIWRATDTTIGREVAVKVSQVEDPKRQQEVRDQLTHWKKDADLAPGRDPEWLAPMPAADRKAWENLWSEVDALLASINQQAGSPPAKP
jgi:hypothetical protein